jgi:Icc-related predicted phosphoesterase
LGKTIKIFYASDVHGSDVCFKKFINAASFYGVDILILGGDITGKMIVPIIEQPNGSFEANFLGKQVILNSEEEVKQLEQKIRNAGFYPYRTNPQEVTKLKEDEKMLNELFSRLMMESVKKWIEFAESKLQKLKVKCFIMPGNDDQFIIDQVLNSSKIIVNPEGKALHLDEHHEMVSTGYANITPWRCPRDVSEEELAEKINNMISQVDNIKNCIFNFHCPPYGTTLDLAPKLDENLKPIVSGGSFVMEHVGSKAIRKAIEEYQPLLGLHGHIHESRGIDNIGRTICLNAGSEYTEGILRGIIITLSEGKIKSYYPVSG